MSRQNKVNPGMYTQRGCDEKDDGNQGGSVECQGNSREGEDSRDPQVEEHARQGKDG